MRTPKWIRRLAGGETGEEEEDGIANDDDDRPPPPPPSVQVSILPPVFFFAFFTVWHLDMPNWVHHVCVAHIEFFWQEMGSFIRKSIIARSATCSPQPRGDAAAVAEEEDVATTTTTIQRSKSEGHTTPIGALLKRHMGVRSSSSARANLAATAAHDDASTGRMEYAEFHRALRRVIRSGVCRCPSGTGDGAGCTCGHGGGGSGVCRCPSGTGDGAGCTCGHGGGGSDESVKGEIDEMLRVALESLKVLIASVSHWRHRITENDGVTRWLLPQVTPGHDAVIREIISDTSKYSGTTRGATRIIQKVDEAGAHAEAKLRLARVLAACQVIARRALRRARSSF
jgi:hypothetical protein